MSRSPPASSSCFAAPAECPDGTLGLGLFDVEALEYVQGVEDMISDLEQKWADFVVLNGLTVPYYTDVLVAT